MRQSPLQLLVTISLAVGLLAACAGDLGFAAGRGVLHVDAAPQIIPTATSPPAPPTGCQGCLPPMPRIVPSIEHLVRGRWVSTRTVSLNEPLRFVVLVQRGIPGWSHLIVHLRIRRTFIGGKGSLGALPAHIYRVGMGEAGPSGAYSRFAAQVSFHSPGMAGALYAAYHVSNGGGYIEAGLFFRVVAGGMRQVMAASSDARITLVLPNARRSYPRGALVRVLVRLQNLTDRYENFRFVCGKTDPRVQVLSPQGQVRYPSGAPLLAPPPCPAGQLAPALGPRRAGTFPMYVLLKGSRLHAVWEYGAFTSQFHQIVTPLLPVTLTPSKPPAATLRTSPAVSLTVIPNSGPHGPLVYADAAECSPAGGGPPQYFESTGEFEWGPASGDTIKPGCPHPIRWRVVAAFVGQRSVTVDYTARGSRRTARWLSEGVS